jgi:hypothetical protein
MILIRQVLIAILALLGTGCLYREHCIDSAMQKSDRNASKNAGALDPKLLAAYLISGNECVSSGPINVASCFSPDQTQKVQFEIDSQDLPWDGTVKISEHYDDLKGTATDNDCFHLFEYIGNWGEYEIYWVLARGGGSGTFTNIHFFKMSEGKLHSFSVGVGDRALGGIFSHPIFANGKLYFYRRFCDDDLASAAGIKFDSMEGCATGVAAIGLFAFDPNKRDENPNGKLVQLRLVEPRQGLSSHNYSKFLSDKISKNQVIFKGQEMEALWRELRGEK